jgi:ATP-dependent Zn protease
MKSRERKAYHEAGHVVSAYFLGIPLEYSTIARDNGKTREPLGWTQPKERNVSSLGTKTADKYAIFALAGTIAEWHLFEPDHDALTTSIYDNVRARQFIRSSGHALNDEELKARIRGLHETAEEFLLTPENWARVEVVAEALMEKEKLDPGQIERLLNKS